MNSAVDAANNSITLCVWLRSLTRQQIKLIPNKNQKKKAKIAMYQSHTQLAKALTSSHQVGEKYNMQQTEDKPEMVREKSNKVNTHSRLFFI